MVEAARFLGLASHNGRSSKGKEQDPEASRGSRWPGSLCAPTESISPQNTLREENTAKNPNYQTANHEQSSRLKLSQPVEVKQKEKYFIQVHAHRSTPGLGLASWVWIWTIHPANRTRSRCSPCLGVTPDPAGCRVGWKENLF